MNDRAITLTLHPADIPTLETFCRDNDIPLIGIDLDSHAVTFAPEAFRSLRGTLPGEIAEVETNIEGELEDWEDRYSQSYLDSLETLFFEVLKSTTSLNPPNP